MPQFVEFSPERFRAERERPQFSFDVKGNLSFNHAAFLALEQPRAVVLLLDASEAIVALRKASLSDSNALPVRPEPTDKQHYFVDGSQDFVTYFDLPIRQAMHFLGRPYGESLWGFSLQEPHKTGEDEPNINDRAITARWQHTTDGARVSALIRVGDMAMSHPEMSTTHSSRASTLRLGVLIASSDLDNNFTTSTLRARFLTLLRSRAITSFLKEVSDLDPNAQWSPYAGRGREVHEAILTTETIAPGEHPTASALMILPGGDASNMRRDAHYTTLVLDTVLSGRDGQAPMPAPLSVWYDRFRRALAIPEAFRRNLTEAMKLRTFAQPPALIGIWLRSPHSILEIVDIDGLNIIPGSPTSNWFTGLAVSDPQGESARQVAADMLAQLCDYSLHLDGYERILARLVNTTHR